MEKIKGYSLLIASDLDGGIGKGGTFPWPRIDKDVQHFVEVTKNEHVYLPDNSNRLLVKAHIYLYNIF